MSLNLRLCLALAINVQAKQVADTLHWYVLCTVGGSCDAPNVYTKVNIILQSSQLQLLF